MSDAKPLRDKVAVITGGSNGIGAAAVHAIANLGAMSSSDTTAAKSVRAGFWRVCRPPTT